MKLFSFALTACILLFVAACSSGDETAGHRAAANPTPSAQKVASVGSLVAGVEARLQDNPDDGKGWLLLAKSYKHLQRLDEARVAYDKATTLGFSDEKLAADLFGIRPAVAARLINQLEVGAEPTQ